MRKSSSVTGGLQRADVAAPACSTIKKGLLYSPAWMKPGFDAKFRDQEIMKFGYPEVQSYITSEKFDVGSDLRRIFKLTAQIVSSPIVDSCRPSVPLVAPEAEKFIEYLSQIYTQVVSVFGTRMPKLLAEYPFHSLHPVLDAAKTTTQGLSFEDGQRFFRPDGSGSYDASIQNFVAQLLALKRKLQRISLSEEVKTFERIFLNRRNAVRKIFDGVLKACSNVTFVHIVMGGQIDGFLGSDTPLVYSCTSNEFDAEARTFAQRRDKFMLILHKQFGRNLLGYVWRIDCCPAKGFQLSMILSFNGHKFPSESALEQEVGSMWISTDHAEEGSHWCQRLKPLLGALQQSQIGHSTPPDLTPRCIEIAEKFCFGDRYFKLKLPGDINGFRKQLNRKRH